MSISDACDAVTMSDQYDAFSADVKCEFWSCAAVCKLRIICGQAPLGYAASNGHYEVVKTLMQHPQMDDDLEHALQVSQGVDCLLCGSALVSDFQALFRLFFTTD